MSRSRLLVSVALYIFTGMFTSPKPIAPVHIGLIHFILSGEIYYMKLLCPFFNKVILAGSGSPLHKPRIILRNKFYKCQPNEIFCRIVQNDTFYEFGFSLSWKSILHLGKPPSFFA